jgi:hypothetical protein
MEIVKKKHDPFVTLPQGSLGRGETLFVERSSRKLSVRPLRTQ